LRQRLQHRSLAASQPYTGKCALTLQPAVAYLLSVIPDLPRDPVISGSDMESLRQRLQHRSLAASQPYTGKCALTLQPAVAYLLSVIPGSTRNPVGPLAGREESPLGV